LVLAAAWVAAACGGTVSGPTVPTPNLVGNTTSFRWDPVADVRVEVLETGEAARSDGNGRFALLTQRVGPVTLKASKTSFVDLVWSGEAGTGRSVVLRVFPHGAYDPALAKTLVYVPGYDATFRWRGPEIRYKLEFQDSIIERMLVAAFEVWGQASGGLLRFVPDPGGTLVVRVVPHSPCGYPTAAGCGGPTRLDSQGYVVAGIIELVPTADHKTITHEVGHALGLLGHSTNPSHVMYPGGAERPSAPADAEAATVCALYANPPLQPAARFSWTPPNGCREPAAGSMRVRGPVSLPPPVP
jgi:hypothetical protein